MLDVRRLDRSIESGLRGDRTVDFDPEIRALVRLARQMRSPGEGLTPDRRQAIRARVFRQLDAASDPSRVRALSQPTAKRQARRVAHAVAVLILALGLAGGATVAAGGSSPDESLSEWKLALDEARTQLAISPHETAAVLLPSAPR
jgi:hypothetical protein